MESSRNPPPLNDDLFQEDDDDNEDLFVSAYEQPKTKSSNEEPKPATETPPAAPVVSGFGSLDELDGDEIDLGDDGGEDDDSKSDDKFEKQAYSSSTKNIEESGDSFKAILSTSSSITSNASETVVSKQLTSTIGKNDVLSDEQTKKDQLIEISVGEPQKVGEGMGSYVVYRVTTKTSLPYFRRTSFSVNRRFSDFLGLRDKLAEKHLHLGRIIPPAPDKNAVGTAKVKMSKDDGLSSTDFIEKRRAALERYLNRNAAHQSLCTDPDFREFLELDTDLPRATNTSALSGAGVKRLFNRVGDTVNKMTFRMDETDPWFEEKQNQIENLDQQIRKLHSSVETLIYFRKDLSLSTSGFAKSIAMLGNGEEHTTLSCALSQLADIEEKIEQLYNEQVNHDFFHLSELLKDYIALIGSVKDVFHQRVKVFQTWQHAQQMLTKKREQKVRFELAGRNDKIQQANEEVIDWEAKVNRGKSEFESISKNIKQEVERFDGVRVKDFKIHIIKYMEKLLETQQQLTKYWETFLPEAKAIA